MSSLFVAWRPAEPRLGWRPVGRLEHHDGLYRFWYTEGARRDNFRMFSRMENIQDVYESEELFPIFANRLLSKSRPEYDAYLRWSGFDVSITPDPIVVLGITEGIRQTDAIEVFPCPIPDGDGCYMNKFFLHGIRWMSESVEQRIAKLKIGEPLKLMADMQNEFDEMAVAVRTEEDRAMLGYVPRYLARDCWTLFQKCDTGFIELSVAQVNLDAPMQNRLLCKIKACWPGDGFIPCSGGDFEPIPSDVHTHC